MFFKLKDMHGLDGRKQHHKF